MRAPVLAALDQQKRRGVLSADHPAIDADVHHARVGIARDDARERVDVAPALAEIPLGDGKFGLIHGVAADDHFLHRPRRHHARGNRLAVLLHDVLHQLGVADVLGEAERQRESAAVAESVGQHPRAAASAIALDVLEEQRGRLFLQRAARDRADLAVPVDLGADAPQLVLLLEQRDPPAQIHEALAHRVPPPIAVTTVARLSPASSARTRPRARHGARPRAGTRRRSRSTRLPPGRSTRRAGSAAARPPAAARAPTAAWAPESSR